MKHANQSTIRPGTVSKQLCLTNFLIKPKPSSTVTEVRTNDIVEKCSNFESETNMADKATTSSDNSKKINQRRKFQTSWLMDLTWLEYDPDSGVAKCKVCFLFPTICDRTSKVVNGFNGPFKLETFKKHAKSLQHLKAFEAQLAQQNPSSTPLAKCVKRMDVKMFQYLKTAFTAAYYIAKNNKPFSDFKELLVLIKKCNVEVLEEYTNRIKCKEFIKHIATIIRYDLVNELKKCTYVSLLLDGSTDKSGIEELILHVRYLKEYEVKEDFLSIIPLEDVSANGYLRSIHDELNSLGLEKWMKGKGLVGVGTDGAAAMVGSEKGLVTQMSKEEGLHHLISVHCVAHKLNLSVLSSVKNVKYLEEIDVTLRKLYKFFQHSPRRMRQLKKVAAILGTEIVKFKYLHTVRWVASKVSALAALLQDWKCVVVYLEDVAGGKGEEAATAKGLLRKLKDFRFVSTIHFLSDYLSIFKQISLIFQKEELLLSSIDLHISKGLMSLENLKLNPGQMESKFNNNTSIKGVFQEIQLVAIENSSFEKDKLNLVNSGIHFLKERFSWKNSVVISALAVFDTFTWPKGKELEIYGEKEVEVLGHHFIKQLDVINGEVDLIQCLQNEWYEFKVLGQGLKLRDLLVRALSMQKRFPVLSQLLSIIAVLPVSTAACERGFSLMNLIKNKFRTSTESDSLNDLMTINTNGPALNDFDPQKAVDHWYFEAKNTRHVHGHNNPNVKKMKA